MAAPSQYGDATIAPGFVVRKSKILSDLSVPDAEYTDLSPKGSVDEGIRDLIRDINALDGLVTTSSCAGRVSIFVEGSKKTYKKRKTDTAADGNPQAIEQAAGQVPSQLDHGKIDDPNQDESEDEDGFANKEGDAGRKFALSGGKGEGRWLYVSHDPVDNNIKSSYHELFGLVPGDGVPRTSTSGDANMRLIRFHYDPMVRAAIFNDILAS
jgi:tRNA wybutosine-synthesizing protein 3